MKDIEIVISKDTRMVELSQTTIGNDGENLQSKLVFTFEDGAFVDGQARLEYYANGEKYWTVAEKKENSYEVPVLSVMANEGRIDMQLVITEGADENEIPIFKSNMFYVYCNSSINAEIEQPEEYPEWIDRANTKLNEVDNLNVEMNDGVVTITKKDGTTYSENVRGPEGPQGKAGAVKLIPVAEFPTEGIETDAIYIKPSENPDEQNVYDEYVYVNGNWEKISGGASVNLDGYATEDYVNNAIANSESIIIGTNAIIANLKPVTCNSFRTNVSTYVWINNTLDPYLNEKVREVISKAFELNLPFIIRYFDGNGDERYTGLVEIHCGALSASTTYKDGIAIFRAVNGSVWKRSFRVSYRNSETSGFSISEMYLGPSPTLLAPYKGNNTEFTPTRNYDPATKKYVDDAVANVSVDLTGYATEDYVNNVNGTKKIDHIVNASEKVTNQKLYDWAQTIIDDYVANGATGSRNITQNYVTENGFVPSSVDYYGSSSFKRYTIWWQKYIKSGYTSTYCYVYTPVDSNVVMSSDSSYPIQFYSFTNVTFITSHQSLSNYLSKTNTGVYTPTGDYNPATKKYVDDAEISITEKVNENYLSKTNITEYTPTASYNPCTKGYAESYANSLFSNSNNLKFSVVAELPTENISSSTIYLAGTTSPYSMYMYINESWQLLGTTELDIQPEIIIGSDSIYTIDVLLGNKSYKLGALTNLNITETSVFDRETVIYFNSEETATSVSMPTTISNVGDHPEMTELEGKNTGVCEVGKNYIISILNNIAMWKAY